MLFVTDPIEGCAHDLRALDESDVKALLGAAATVVADRGYRGSGYLMPRRKPDGGQLTRTDHEYNAKVSSLHAPIERATANLKPGACCTPTTAVHCARSTTRSEPSSASNVLKEAFT